MAGLNFKGRDKYRRFPRSLRLQVVEDSSVGEIVANRALNSPQFSVTALAWIEASVRRIGRGIYAILAEIILERAVIMRYILCKWCGE